MTYTEIKDLLSNGFTAEQITMLTTSATLPSVADVEPTEETTPPVVPSEVESPCEVGEDLTEDQQETSPTEQGTTNAVPDALEEIRKQLKTVQEENEQLRKLVQGNNIRDRTFTTPTAPDASNMLAEIIRPTFHNNAQINH